MSFGKNNSENSAGMEAFLGKDSKVTGTLKFQGPVELGGFVEGELQSEGKLIIAETAEIKAKIKGKEIVVRGTIHGDIEASEKLSLLKPAKVYGNIISKSLSIEEGVVFEGSCQMQGAPARSSVTASSATSQPAPQAAAAS